MNKLYNNDTKNLSKVLLARKNMNKNFHVHCYIIGWHSNSLRNNVNILNKKIQLRHTFKGGNKVFCNVYISMVIQSSTVKVHI